MEQFVLGEAFRNTLDTTMERIGSYAPDVLAAVVLILVGWLLARLFRLIARRVAGLGLVALGRNHHVNHALERTNLKEQMPRIIGIIVYWAVLLFFISVAAERLDFGIATTIISSITFHLPKILVGGIIILAFFIFGHIVYTAITRSAGSIGVTYSNLLGRIAQVLVFSLGIVVGAEEMGIASSFLTAVVAIIFATTLGGAALAFGLGSGLAISNIVSAHYLNRIYKVGQIVRIGDRQGRIVAINQTGFVLDTAEGQVLIPGRQFSKEASTLLKEEQL